MILNSNLLLCISICLASSTARASGLSASDVARASARPATARASELRASEAACASAGPATARARALAGHDHEHPVCDEEYRSTVCPAACDADTLRDKCCIHEGEVATLLTVAMEAQSRAIAPRVERFEECTGGHVELVPFVGACTGLSCGGFSDLFEIPERKAMVWDLLVYANVNALEVVSGKLGPTYLDPFRRSHLDATARDTWIPPYDAAAK